MLTFLISAGIQYSFETLAKLRMYTFLISVSHRSELLAQRIKNVYVLKIHSDLKVDQRSGARFPKLEFVKPVYRSS